MFKKKTNKRNWGHHFVVILLQYSQPRNELKPLYYKGIKKKNIYILYIYCIFTNKHLQSLHLFPAFFKLWLVSDGDEQKCQPSPWRPQVVPAVPSTVHRPHPGPPFWRWEMAGWTAPRAGRRFASSHGSPWVMAGRGAWDFVNNFSW